MGKYNLSMVQPQSTPFSDGTDINYKIVFSSSPRCPKDDWRRPNGRWRQRKKKVAFIRPDYIGTGGVT